MTRLLQILRLNGLAGRLALIILAALGVAQLVLAITLKNREDFLIQQVIHQQALLQAVPIFRLMQVASPDKTSDLTAAFRSRSSCVEVLDGPPAAFAMNANEAEAAAVLEQMLHGKAQGATLVKMSRGEGAPRFCKDGAPPPGEAAHPQEKKRPHVRTIDVKMQMPIHDEKWLSVTSAVEVPPTQNGAIALIFLASSLIVGGAAIFAIRLQTRSLRTLADASDRFGRGEHVPPLAESGPSEVVTAIRAFNTMQERLSSFLRDRLRLLASISHDLRTPLTTLRLKAEFVEDQATRDSVIRTVDELTMICEATLAFTRAETTSEPTANIDLRDLVFEVCGEMQTPDGNVHAAPMPSVLYACRPVAMKRALRNLVQNALRYGESAEVFVTQTSGGIVLGVDDKGPGIEATKIEEAFQPFVRLEASRSLETGGMGLGLAIARSIVKAHGGTVDLSNRPEGGLRAEIRLPPQNSHVPDQKQ